MTGLAELLTPESSFEIEDDIEKINKLYIPPLLHNLTGSSQTLAI